MLSLSLLLLHTASALAYLAPMGARSAVASRTSSIVAMVPELYVYDHCPFCVRVRRE